MQVLVISLLRPGDLLMMAKALFYLNKIGVAVSLLTSRENRNLRPIFKEIKNWYFFDREFLQFGLGEAEIPLEGGIRHLKNLVAELAENPWDQVINLTNTFISAHFMELIPATIKQGICYDNMNNRFFISGNGHALRLLNRKTECKPGQGWAIPANPFLFSDLFYLMVKESFEGDASLKSDLLPSSIKNENPQLRNKNKILLQIVSQDDRKNFPLMEWSKLIQSIGYSFQEFDLVILSGPKEESNLKQFIKTNPFPENVSLFAGSFLEVFNLADEARLLITVDTSIKHLLALKKVPTLELALGPSLPHETGVPSKGSIIFKSLRSDCLKADDVFFVVKKMLQNKGCTGVEDLARFAQENQNRFFLYEVTLDSFEFSYLCPLFKSHGKDLLAELIFRSLVRLDKLKATSLQMELDVFVHLMTELGVTTKDIQSFIYEQTLPTSEAWFAAQIIDRIANKNRRNQNMEIQI